MIAPRSSFPNATTKKCIRPPGQVDIVDSAGWGVVALSEGREPDVVRVGGMLDVHHEHARMGHGRDAMKRLSMSGNSTVEAFRPLVTKDE